jgi:hypothetical protein
MLSNTKSTPRRRAGLFADLQSVAVHGIVIALMAIGVGGFLYKSLRPGGWLSGLTNGLVAGGSWSVFFGIGALIGVGLVVRQWLDAPESTGTRGDLVLYAAMGLGVFFTFELIVNGSL